jgi:peptidase E
VQNHSSSVRRPYPRRVYRQSIFSFLKINIAVKGIHEFEDLTSAIETLEGIFTGGGNTFVLVNELYKTTS